MVYCNCIQYVYENMNDNETKVYMNIKESIKCYWFCLSINSLMLNSGPGPKLLWYRKFSFFFPVCLNVKPFKIYIYKYIQNTKISMNFFIQEHFETEPAWMPSCLTKLTDYKLRKAESQEWTKETPNSEIFKSHFLHYQSLWIICLRCLHSFVKLCEILFL